VSRWVSGPSMVARGALSDWPLTLAVWLLLTSATTMLVAGLGYVDAVAAASLRHAVAAAPAADRGVTVGASVAASDVSQTDATVTTTLSRALSGARPEVVLDLRSPDLVVRAGGGPAGGGSAGGVPPGQRLTVLASYGNLEAHVSLVQGRWPSAGQDPVEASLSEPAARALGLAVGNVVSLGDASVPAGEGEDPPAIVRVKVTGIWRGDASDPYWLSDSLDLNGVTSDASRTTRGPFLVASSDMLRAGAFASFDLRWRAIPALDALQVGAIDDLRQNIEALPFQFRAGQPGLDATVGIGLASVLRSAERTISVSSTDLTLLALLFAALAGYTILLAGGMLADRRRGRLSLLRARGASAAAVTAVSLAEAVLLTVPAAAIALLAATPVTALATAIGPLAGSGIVPLGAITANGLLVSAAAGVICVAVLTLPNLVSGPNLAGVRARLGRPFSRTLPQRLGLDLVLAVVAGIGLWQLRSLGTGQTSGAGPGAPDMRSDPLLLAAPALGLLAGAVLATRLVPRLAEIAERLVGRGPGLLPMLVARQVARRPLRYTRVALLLVLAAAGGTFAVTYLASWTQSQSDQAAYAAAVDVRAVAPAYAALPASSVGSEYAAIPGVRTAMPVGRESVDLGRTVRGAELLSLDPATADCMVGFPDDGTRESMATLLSQLAAARPGVDAAPVVGRPKRLALILDVDLRSDFLQGGFLVPGNEQFPPGTKGIDVAITALDGDLRLQRFEGGAAFLSGAGQRIEVLLTSGTGGELTPVYPLRIESIELTVDTNGTPASGSIDLRGVAASADVTGDTWHAVALDPAGAGWQWVRTDDTQVHVLRTDPTRPGRVETTVPEGLDSPMGFYVHTVFRLWAPPVTGSVPVIASDRFLELSGTRVGDSVTVAAAGGEKLQVKIVGRTSEFPPLDPRTAFLVADGESRELARLVDLGQTAPAAEWWLSVAPGSEAAVAQAAAAAPLSASDVVVRNALANSFEREPVALGVLGSLLLGAFGALAFAILGLLATAMVSVRERLGELALLRAIGLSTGQMRVWLSVEQAFLLAAGLVAGSGLGLLLGWLTLPFAVPGATGAPAVPVPALVVPWQPFLAFAGLAVALLAGVLLLFIRQLPAGQVAGVLRNAEE
jgi:hypothetical protein